MKRNETVCAGDERLVQESHAVMAKNFRMAMLLLGALLLAKAAGMLAGLPWYAWAPEAAGLLSGGITCSIWLTLRGLWGASDERVDAERARCLSASSTVAHCTALLTATALLFLDGERTWLYTLTMLAMTLIQYLTMGRMTRAGLYGGQKASIARRLIPITAAVLIAAPVMMWATGVLRHQTFPAWVYALLEGILLASCLLGGLLVGTMTKRSGENARAQLEQAEGSDEE